jgi:hypothetical protein
MSEDGQALTLHFTYRGFKKELYIPFGNVILMELAPEEAPKKAK